MPLEIDYEFGKAAVKTGLLRQDQLEECVEVLVALERVGSQQRLWDIVRRKAYMSTTAIMEVRQSVAAGPVPPLRIEADETAEDMQIPERCASGYVVAHIVRGGKVQLFSLPQRLLTLGRDSACDIVLSEKDVAEQQARMRISRKGYSVEETGRGSGVLVNERRIKLRELIPNDLIQLGSAQLLFLPEFGEEPTPEPTTPAAVEGTPTVRLKVADGPHRGMAYFFGSSSLVIGRHRLANVRLTDPTVSEFHAHVAFVPTGVRVLDLKSTNGIRVNGLAVTSHALREGDNITIGPVTFVFTVLRTSEARTPAAPAVERPAPPPPAATAAPVAPKPPAIVETRDLPAADPAPDPAIDDYKVPEVAEVEPISDPMMRQGIDPLRGAPGMPPVRIFKPGQLQFSCVEGPLEGRKFIIAKTRTSLGRDENVDIRIDDASASRRHAEFVLGEKDPELRDAGSRNGVFVNNRRVTSAAVRPGDALRIGNCLFIVEEVLPPPPRRRKP